MVRGKVRWSYDGATASGPLRDAPSHRISDSADRGPSAMNSVALALPSRLMRRYSSGSSRSSLIALIHPST